MPRLKIMHVDKLNILDLDQFLHLRIIKIRASIKLETNLFLNNSNYVEIPGI